MVGDIYLERTCDGVDTANFTKLVVIFQKDDVSKRFQFTSSLEHRLFIKDDVRRSHRLQFPAKTMYIVFEEN